MAKLPTVPGLYLEYFKGDLIGYTIVSKIDHSEELPYTISVPGDIGDYDTYDKDLLTNYSFDLIDPDTTTPEQFYKFYPEALL